MNLFNEIISSEGMDYEGNHQTSRKRTVIDQNEFAQMKAKYEPNLSNAIGFTELYLQDCYRPNLKTNSGGVLYTLLLFYQYRHLMMIVMKTLLSS